VSIPSFSAHWGVNLTEADYQRLNKSSINTSKHDERESAARNESEPLLNEYDLAEITGRSVASVRRGRFLGKGCPYVKLGFLVKYRPSDVRSYIARNARRAQPEAPKCRGAEYQQ
jgi:hypothetical protein